MVGIYRRVSKDEQALNGLSLDNQELRGKELAAKLGLSFKVFTDAGLSGAITFDKRPGLNELINQIYSGDITIVFITDLDRLSRGDLIQTTLIQNIFRENNVRLFDLSNEINLNDINVGLLTDMRSLLNAYELKKLSGRIRTVLEKNIQDGKAQGGSLMNYGYMKDKNKMLVINDKEADTVLEIYALALNGKSTRAIAKILNDKGILTKRGNVLTGGATTIKGKLLTEFLWADVMVHRVLTRTIYKGERLYKGKIYTNIPALVDATTFDLVQDLLKNRDRFKDTTNRHNFLLKGLIDCKICGCKFYGKKGGNKNSYSCSSNRNSRSRTGKNCGSWGIGIDYLDALAIEHILNLDKLIEGVFADMYDT